MIRRSIVAVAAGAVLAAGLTAAIATQPASASSAGCAFTNGCATLNGTDATGVVPSHAVSMDAKYKNPAEILIGYPDVPGDGASSFDKVLHFHSGLPFYTFVFANDGVWSNRCVTDINGSGALRLETCTLGHNQGQDFFAEQTPGGSGAHLQIGVGSYYIQNWLASEADAPLSCLTDPSTLIPGTPESDFTDELPGGRQLRVDGACSTVALNLDLWTWAA